MLKWIHRMEELDFNALMEIYAEACIENGQEFWPDLPAEEQIRHSQEHFRSYLQEQFFAKPEAVYAVWLVEGRYVTALRLEPKWDGLLMEALETRPDARCQGHASALITAVQEKHPDAKPVISPSDGTLLWEVPVTGQAMNPPMGTAYKEGDLVCFVEAYYGQDEVKALYDGKLLQVVVKQGEKVRKGDVIAFLN